MRGKSSRRQECARSKRQIEAPVRANGAARKQRARSAPGAPGLAPLASADLIPLRAPFSTERWRTSARIRSGSDQRPCPTSVAGEHGCPARLHDHLTATLLSTTTHQAVAEIRRASARISVLRSAFAVRSGVIARMPIQLAPASSAMSCRRHRPHRPDNASRSSASSERPFALSPPRDSPPAVRRSRLRISAWAMRER